MQKSILGAESPGASLRAALILGIALCLQTIEPAKAVEQGSAGSRKPVQIQAHTPMRTPDPITTIPQDTAQLALRTGAGLGEGAIWHPGRYSLLWVDIEGKTLHEYIPVTDSVAQDTTAGHAPDTTPAVTRQWHFDRMVSTVVPESDSTVIVALQNTIVRINLDTDMRSTLASIDDRNGRVRCNDGKCDPSGRLWIGTMAFAGTQGAGTLYCMEPDGTATVRLDSVTISNGIAWSADRSTMYYIDTPTRRVARYRYDDATGAICYDGIAIEVPEEYGSPDGMTIDAEGNLWIAHWGGSGVYCWDPQTGQLLRKIVVPCPNVTSCAFGGKNLDTLYITTAGGAPGSDLRARYPLSGSLFACKPGVIGVTPLFFSKKN